MASLSTHLRHLGDHGRLSLHRACPVCCRDRLAGSLRADAIVGRRAQALLAAGVIALSAATPPAVFAAEPDQEQEGTTPPEQATAPEAPPSSDPAYDPGGDPTNVPLDQTPATDVDPVTEPAGNDVLDPIDQEDPTDGIDPGEPGDGPSAPAADQPVAPPTQMESPAPPAAAPEAPAATAPSPAAPTPLAEPQAPGPNVVSRAEKPARREHPARPRRQAPRDSSAAVPAPAPTVSVSPAPAVSSPASGASTTVLVQTAQAPRESARHRRATRPGDRVHVVARGESLWSIAADLLGEDASVARTAREVSRLWELNRAGIRTGDPDLLMPGTRLVLR